jgi:predicted acylesterase/phospholipase RssA
VDQKIALCLSGGGFRATLFHLGVVKALRAHLIDGEIALHRVTELYAVSGGSILAAHMLKNWDLYTSADDADFKKAADQLLAFARRDVRNRVFRRAGLTFLLKKSSTQWLNDEYRSKHFLGPDTLDTSYTKIRLPKFHFLTTNFNSGELCSFSGTDFELLERKEDGIFETHITPAGSIPLAFAVAASSSFPVAFPPITLTPRALGHPEDPNFQMPIELSDGGVYDNFGIEKFVMAQREGSTPKILIVSNAGGSFQADPQKTYDDILPRNIRASDVMMRRVGEGTLQAGRAIAGDGFILVRIGATTKSSNISKTSQQMLRLVRTDLDRFDEPLAGLLVDHGEGVARDALKAKGWQATSEFSAQDSIKSNDVAAGIIERAARRGKVGFLLDIRDLAWVGAWWLLLLGTILGSIFGSIKFVEEMEHKRQEEIGKQVKREVSKVVLAYQSGNQANLREAIATAAEAAENAADPKGSQTVRLDRENPTVVPTSAEPGIAMKSDRQSDLPLLHAQAVFIQFAGVLTRDQIRGLNANLRRYGWQTQSESGERIATAYGFNEVRFSGDNELAAGKLADAINQSGIPLAAEVKPQRNARIKDNHLEVWISR